MEGVIAVLQYLVHHTKMQYAAQLVLPTANTHCRPVCNHLANHTFCNAVRPVYSGATCTNCAIPIYLFPLFGFLQKRILDRGRSHTTLPKNTPAGLD